MSNRWRCGCGLVNDGVVPCTCGTVSPFVKQPTPRMTKHILRERDEWKALADARLALVTRYAKENERLIAENMRLLGIFENLRRGRRRRVA